MTRSFILASQWSIPKRYLSMTLFDGREGGRKSNKILAWADEKANVSFSTVLSAYGLASEANVTITGLTRDKMLYLATSYTSWTKNKIHNIIKIDAGYDNKHGLIYEGTVIEAIPNLNQANFSISLKCITQYGSRVQDIMSLSYEGEVNVTTIVDRIAKAMKFVPVYNESVRDIKTTYSLSDSSPQDHIRYLAKITGLDIFTDKNRIIVKKTGEEVKGFNVLKIDDSNIIGSPEPTAIGCNVAVKMDCSVMAGMIVELKSLRFPTITTDYILSSYYHSGETKGNKWTTYLNLIRRDLKNVIEGNTKRVS